MNVLCFALLMASVIFMYTKMVIAVLEILISLKAPILSQILHPHQQKYCLKEVKLQFHTNKFLLEFNSGGLRGLDLSSFILCMF